MTPSNSPALRPWPPGPALLFCPADRPERFAKAAAAADAVIVDLEDAVAPHARAAARAALRDTRLDPATTVVRINPAGSPDHFADLDAVTAAGYDTVMLAKAESPQQVAALAPLRVIALCETARGILAAPAIAAGANVTGLMWGAEDFVASVGGRGSRAPAGGYRTVAAHARSQVLIAAAAHGLSAIDAVFLAVDDLDGLRAEALDAAACGFSASACIHPRQVPTVRAAYRPAPAELDTARAVLAAARERSGAFVLDGRMVDEVVLTQAARTVARGESGSQV